MMLKVRPSLTRISRNYPDHLSDMLRSIPRRIEQVHLSISSLSVLPSPVNRRVGIHDFTFGACSSFTRVAACQIACPPIADVCPEPPPQPVTRPSRSVATMLIDVYMDGSSSHWRPAPLRRTVNYRVGTLVRVPERSEHPPVVNKPRLQIPDQSSCLR